MCNDKPLDLKSVVLVCMINKICFIAINFKKVVRETGFDFSINNQGRKKEEVWL